MGPYELLAPIGAGGMGEVYRAKDIKLDRNVAIKVLPSAVAQDPDRLMRFEREAKILASLNHPNIAHIYGVEENGATRALVMELVQGSTLSVPQAIDTALQYARQIAEALEAAHEKGITHRDLKPANIMITPEGIVKVLDFGLAAVPTVLANGDPASSPTFTLAATQGRMIMGTAGYMSPEQASGKAVDRRSDIWSFGVVLWEMLTGEQLFTGETASHTVADVLRAPIDFSKLPASTPARIVRLLKRCLDRNVRTRLQSIGEARIAIDQQEEQTKGGAQDSSPANLRSGRTAGAPWGVAALFAVSAAALGYVAYRHTQEPPPKAIKTYIMPPEHYSFVENSPPALSPDGRKLAFAAARDGKALLWIRDLDSLEARSISGTDGARGPFWSPDSQSLGFIADGKLKRIDIGGGSVMTLCATEGNAYGGSWSSRGVILFPNSATSALYRIPATGGTPVPVTTLDPSAGEVSHRLPWFLPDGRHFLFAVRSQAQEARSGVYVGDLDSRQRTLVLQKEGHAAYVHTGRFLIFTTSGTALSPLMAQAFDVSKFRATGDPFPVAESVNLSTGVWAQRQFSVAGDGTLVYAANSSPVRLTWLDHAGKVLGYVGVPDPARRTVAISPDGTTVAAESAQSGSVDIWLHDLTRGASSRFTFNAAPAASMTPVWAPDGKSLLFAYYDRTSPVTITMRKSLAGSSMPERIATWGDPPRPASFLRWSPDGRYVVARLNPGLQTGSDIWMMPMSPPDQKPRPFLHSNANEGSPGFSPGSDWLAYESDETRRFEIYIQAFPAGGRKHQASIDGGRMPVWSRDGKELYFIAPDGQMMSVPIASKGGNLEIGTPKALFQSNIVTASNNFVTFDVSKDGRFLIPQQEQASGLPLTLLVNWQSRLKQTM
jgi:eukaryotic-like serine/threonine-protein kinase